jgi:hypothetical protein
LLADAFAELPPAGHQQLATMPGIGVTTAAVLVAKIIDIDRFASAEHLVGYFGIFPEEESSGVDKNGQPLPAGTLRMSHKGNDLVRQHLWNAGRCASQHNPAVRALYQRLRQKGKRGDVALGHCMRKLLHLVFAVWKTNRPFDANHFPWQPAQDSTATTPPAAAATATDNDAAVGHTQAMPAQPVVATATATVAAPRATVQAAAPPPPAGVRVDFAFLRSQITIEQVLRHLGAFADLRGSGQQRRGWCPVHGKVGSKERTFSVHLGKNAFQCFQAECGAQGNVLDLWAAVQGLPLDEAALHLAETFGLPRNREEEPVRGTR